MFKIMLSEIEYFKFHIFLVYGIILLIFIGEMFVYGVTLNFIMVITSIIFFITTARYRSSCEREQRNRLHTLLPISVKTIGKQRLLVIVLHQACISLIWLFLLLMKPEQGDLGNIWAIVSIFMFNLIIVCIITISDDLDFYGIKFHKPMLAFMIAGSIILYVLQYQHFNFSDPDFSDLDLSDPDQYKAFKIFKILTTLNAYSDFFRKPVGALFMGLFASLLFYMVYKIYINRKSYLS